jgi:hypothetical protein
MDQLQSAVQLLLQRPSGRKHERQGNASSSSSRPCRSTASWGQSGSSQQQQQGGGYPGGALDPLAEAGGPQAKRHKLQPAIAGITAAAVS